MEDEEMQQTVQHFKNGKKAFTPKLQRRAQSPKSVVLDDFKLVPCTTIIGMLTVGILKYHHIINQALFPGKLMDGKNDTSVIKKLELTWEDLFMQSD